MSNKNNQLKTLYRKGLGSTLVTEKIKNMEENTGSRFLYWLWQRRLSLVQFCKNKQHGRRAS